MHYPQENLAHGLPGAQEGLLAEPWDAREHVMAVGKGRGWLIRAAGAGRKAVGSYSRLPLKFNVQRGCLNPLFGFGATFAMCFLCVVGGFP